MHISYKLHNREQAESYKHCGGAELLRHINRAADGFANALRNTAIVFAAAAKLANSCRKGNRVNSLHNAARSVCRVLINIVARVAAVVCVRKYLNISLAAVKYNLFLIAAETSDADRLCALRCKYIKIHKEEEVKTARIIAAVKCYRLNIYINIENLGFFCTYV